MPRKEGRESKAFGTKKRVSTKKSKYPRTSDDDRRSTLQTQSQDQRDNIGLPVVNVEGDNAGGELLDQPQQQRDGKISFLNIFTCVL